LKVIKKLFYIVASLFCFANSALAEESNSTVNYFVSAEPLGFGLYPFNTQGANVGTVLTPTSEIELSYLQSSSEILLTEIESELVVLRYRFLTGNISYINLGLGQRKVGISYDVQTAEDDFSVNAEIVSLVFEVSFGTRFKFGDFVAGVDWFGIHAPLSTISTKDSFPDDVDQNERKYSEEAFNEIAANTNGQFVRPYIGYRF
jgi:hypothetical protein